MNPLKNDVFYPRDSPLSLFVSKVWQIEGAVPKIIDTIVPQGVIAIVFNFSDTTKFRISEHENTNELPKCSIIGLNTSAIHIDFQNQQSLLGVYFCFHTVKNILGIPSGMFTNNVIDLTTINASIEHLWEQLYSTTSFDNRIKLISEWIVNKKNYEINQKETFFQDFLSNKHNTQYSAKSFANSVGYSARHVARKSHELFGISTENLFRYKRFLDAVQLLHHSNLSLTEITYECKYYDQAHFIREFKKHSAMTPGDYKRLMSHVPYHIFTMTDKYNF